VWIVNIFACKSKDFLAVGQIKELVAKKHPNPVNYKGEYHFRSLSSKQELKGAVLDKFVRKAGSLSFN
jgi:hypothetical protein